MSYIIIVPSWTNITHEYKLIKWIQLIYTLSQHLWTGLLIWMQCQPIFSLMQTSHEKHHTLMKTSSSKCRDNSATVWIADLRTCPGCPQWHADSKPIRNGNQCSCHQLPLHFMSLCSACNYSTTHLLQGHQVGRLTWKSIIHLNRFEW